MSWKDVIITKFFLFFFVLFFFFFKPDCNEVSKMSSLWLCAYATQLGSFITRACRQVVLNVWSKSGRPVSLTTVFADCGRLAGVFLFKKNSSGALKCWFRFSWTNVCVFVTDWALFPLNCSVGRHVFGTTAHGHPRHNSYNGHFMSIFKILGLLLTISLSFYIPTSASVHLYTVNSLGWDHSF